MLTRIYPAPRFCVRVARTEFSATDANITLGRNARGKTFWDLVITDPDPALDRHLTKYAGRSVAIGVRLNDSAPTRLNPEYRGHGVPRRTNPREWRIVPSREKPLLSRYIPGQRKSVWK